jgi:Tol biopolymer transport system component
MDDEVLIMGRPASSLLMWLLIVALLAACGATVEIGGVTVPSPTPVEIATPELEGEPAQCEGRIAFAGRVDGDWDVIVVNADGSGLVNVTHGGGADRAPACSPDGTRIAFERRAGNKDLYIASADGSELLRLTDLPSTEFAPTWSPDGEHLVLAS